MFRVLCAVKADKKAQKEKVEKLEQERMVSCVANFSFSEC